MNPHTLFAPFHRLFADERRRQATDRDLLRAFAQQGEGDAFAELLRRHGPMVLRLALHLLHHRQDAEDVFQATFLTLARKARSLRNDSLAAWLHRVAWRLALRSRAAIRRTAGVSRLVDAGRAPQDPAEEIRLRESQALLHQELAALPERLRLPLVLCYLQGRTRDEAAHQLGWSLGTLKRRLEQGRKLLHARLSRRGVTLSAVLSASLLASAEVSASLADGTLRLATSSLAGSLMALPASVAALVEAPSLKLKALGVFVLMLGTFSGVGAWVYHSGGEAAAPPQARPAHNLPAADKDAKPAAPARDRFGDPLPPAALARMGTIRFRHGDTIEGISLSPDGRTLAAASRDRTARLWDMTTGRELRRLPGHEGHLYSSLRFVAFSPDGKLLATGGSPAQFVHLWDAATGKELRKLQSPYEWLGHVAISADGKTVAAGADRHRIAVWDVATGRVLHKLDGGDEKLTFAVPIAFSPDGRLLAAGDGDRCLSLWDFRGRRLIRRFRGHDSAVRRVAFSPDDKTLASISEQGRLRAWDVADGRQRYQFPVDSPKDSRPTELVFSPDGKLLAYAYYPNNLNRGPRGIRLLDAATGAERQNLTVGDTACYQFGGLGFSADGRHLIGITSGQEIFGWRRESDRFVKKGLLGRVPFAWSAAFAERGFLLADWDSGKAVAIHDFETGRPIRHLPEFPRLERSLAISRDGRYLASGPKFLRLGQEAEPRDTTLRVCETASGQEVPRWRLPPHSACRARTFAPDGRTLIAGMTDTTVLVWDLVPAGKDTAKDVPALWADLADNDAAKAYRARCRLIAAPPDALALLRRRLKPVEDRDDKRIERLIADLDADIFTVREKAAEELRQFGVLAEPACRKALASRPTLELRRRLQGLLEDIPNWRPSPETLRQLRAVEVLERIDAPEARKLLESLAQGAMEAWLTHEARAAVHRFKTHEENKP